MKMKRVASLLVAAVVAVANGDARACKRLGPREHVVDPSMLETDHTPPTLPVIPPAHIDYGDSQGGCGSDCGDAGTIEIPAVATDDMTAPGMIGYRFTLQNGELPPGVTLPTTAVEPIVSNAIYLYWNPSTGRRVDFTLQVVAIDLAGNESAPQTLHIMEANTACAVAHGQASRSDLMSITMLVVLVAAAASRRRRKQA